MTYSACIDYLYRRLPFFSKIGESAIKKDITNTVTLLGALGNPEKRLRTIHLAGTNGKGSCSHMIAAILQAHGYKTGLYTSPHLRDFRERIRINGACVPEAFVISCTERLKPSIEQIEPSFFEVTVAMALEYFAQQEVDVAVIETGLGGRLDSTNVVQPDLSIITNIGFDHMAILGNTLDKIAFEKAGIIKRQKPVVIGEALPETRPVFEAKANAEAAPVFYAERMYRIGQVTHTLDELKVQLQRTDTGQHQTYTCDLPGLYQQYNIRTVLAACQVLRQIGWPLQDALVQKGIAAAAATTGLQGRWQVVHRQPYVVLDVAHNLHGMVPLLQQINSVAQRGRQVFMLYGTSADKDVDAMLAVMPHQYRYAFVQANLPRALDHRELAARALKAGLRGPSFVFVMDALQWAARQAKPNDLIVVFGSVFVVGEVDEAAVKALFVPTPPSRKK